MITTIFDLFYDNLEIVKTTIDQVKHLKIISDSFRVGFIYLNSDRKCLFANNSWKQLTGLSDGEITGDGWLSSIHPNHEKVFRKMLTQTFDNNREILDEIQIITPDGLVKWVEFHASPISLDENEVNAFTVTGIDITERKGATTNLHISEERYKKIVNEATDLIYELDPTGQFIFVNPVASKILNYSIREFIGKHFIQLVKREDRKMVADFYVEQIRQKNPQTYLEFIAITKKGKEIWLGQNVNLTFKNGILTEIQGVARDITNKKTAERSAKVQDTVVRILAESQSMKEAISKLLESLTNVLDWKIGGCWIVDESLNILRIEDMWRNPSDETYAKFESASRSLTFKINEGIPGKVWKTRKPLWIADLPNDKRFFRNEISKTLGINTGFWFPILLGGSVYGVFEFFDNRNLEADDDLLQLMSNIGSQIGQFIERKRAERDVVASETRKSAILESALDCIITINHEGRVLEFNPASERTFGYSRDEAVGKIMGELIVPLSYQEAHQNGISHYLKTGEHNVLGKRIEIIAMRKDGTEFPVELAITPIFIADSKPMFTGYLRDITERKVAEENLRRAKEEAESASIAKSQFLAVMSHEIRTPLNAIIGLGELATETNSESERVEFLEIIQDNSETLLSLINDILDFSKIEAGQIDIEKVEFDLEETVENVLDMFAFKAFAKGLELICRIDRNLPKTVVGDPNRLRQILINLIGNAVKFTARGEVFVDVVLTKSTAKNASIRFSVRDSGIGIAPENQVSIFEKFNQADFSTTRNYGGSGLGLSISKSLIEMMNGEIGLTSELGRGSEFYFSLGYKPLRKTAKIPFVDSFKNLKILVVEDNNSVVAALKEIFASIPSTVSYVVNAAQAIKFIQAESVDLAVIDQTLPMIGGVKLAELLKLNSKSPLNTILLKQDSVEHNKSNDIEKSLSKPVKKSELLHSIAEIFGWIQSSDGQSVETEPIRSDFVPAKILLAEDSSVNQTLAVWILEKAGYEVDIASTGLEAVSLFAKNKYDLILMDIEMPEMDGFQATVEIRKRENGSSIPIIALTAHAIEGYREKCLSFGMNDYLTKPLRREHLLRTIRHFVSSDMSEFENDEETGTTVYVDEDLMDLIPVYLENCHTNIALLNDATTAFDFDTIRRIGHNLKGSGQGYGFEKLSVFGKLLEDDANERNMESIKLTVADLIAYLSQLKVASK